MPLNNLKKMAMGKIYIGQKLIILLHVWTKKGVSRKTKKLCYGPASWPPSWKELCIDKHYKVFSQISI